MINSKENGKGILLYSVSQVELQSPENLLSRGRRRSSRFQSNGSEGFNGSWGVICLKREMILVNCLRVLYVHIYTHIHILNIHTNKHIIILISYTKHKCLQKSQSRTYKNKCMELPAQLWQTDRLPYFPSCPSVCWSVCWGRFAFLNY